MIASAAANRRVGDGVTLVPPVLLIGSIGTVFVAEPDALVRGRQLSGTGRRVRNHWVGAGPKDEYGEVRS